MKKSLEKYFGKDYKMIVVLLIGLVMFFISTTKEIKEYTALESVTPNEVDTATSEFEYERSLEERLETALKEVSGAGNVSVMITTSSSQKKVVSKTVNEKENYVKKEDLTESETDTSEQVVLDENSPFVENIVAPEISGVLIIAEGGDNIEVINAFTNVASSLLNVPAHKVSVLKMKSGQ